MADRSSIVIRGTVTSGGNVTEGVIAKLVLPRPPFDRPRLTLRPETAHQGRAILFGYKGRFDAQRSRTMTGKGGQTIRCEPVYFLDAPTECLSSDIQVTRVHCDPGNVLVTGKHEPERAPERCSVTFWLTPNPQLKAGSWREVNDDGSAEVHNDRVLHAQLTPQVALEFIDQHSWYTLPCGDMARNSFLTAHCEVPFDAHEPETLGREALTALDDFLVFASLASSSRCACTGWEVRDAIGGHTRYYRGTVSRPEQRPSDALDTGLVPLLHFQEFVRLAWPRWRSSPFHEAMRAACFAIVPGRVRTVESQYLAMFAAFEELALANRRQNQLEFVLDKGRFKDVENAIKAAIKGVQPEIGKEHRTMIYDSIAGLNRVLLRRVVDKWIAELDVDVSDLWSVFASPGAGLATIRNKIAHGDFMSDNHGVALQVACDHLRWTVERLVLRLLDWPVELSEARPTLLATHASSMRNLQQARRELDALVPR